MEMSALLFLFLCLGYFFKDCNWLKGYKDLKLFSSLFETHVDFLNGVEIKILIWKSIFISLFQKMSSKM